MDTPSTTQTLDDISLRFSEFEVRQLLGMDATPPVVAGYKLLEILGQGAFGVVYRAWDQTLHRDVALKLTRASQDEERDLLEARALARVNHRNVVSVHAVGSCERRVFVAMELVEGGRLGEWLLTKPSTARVLEVLHQVGAGLIAMHRAGLVHRDIKPSNILVDGEGRAVLVDLGLARVGGAVGTPKYMAPEVRSGRAAGERADQYSFCLVVREALEEVGALHLGNRCAVRALDDEPSRRWSSMNEALDALPRSPPRTARRWVLGSAAVLMLSASALVMSRAGASEALGGVAAPSHPTFIVRETVASGSAREIFDAWAEARSSLRAKSPEIVGPFSAEIALEIERRAETNADVLTAVLVWTTAIDAYEDSGELERGLECRQRAAALLRSIGDDVAAAHLLESVQ